ncbi:MAG: hypothetical protein ACRETM_01730 [Stenotrophobium sp.]
MNKFFYTLLAGALLLPTLAQAQGFGLAYGNWDARVSGTITDNGAKLNLDRDLGAHATNRNSYALHWDTGPGWWRPDIAADYMRIQVAGNNQSTSGGLQFGGIVLAPGISTLLITHADIRDTGVTLRYPFTLGVVRAAAGVTVRRLDGDIRVQDSSGTAQSDQPVNKTFPMAHLRLELPLAPRLSLVASGNWIAGGGNRANDFTAEARARIIGPLSISAGWRYKYYYVSSNGYLLDTRLQGLLLGARLDF